ncbi:GntR family transcriptional regulator [Massilia sp. W12]|uniref:GntR family transcriptional regulator n=1 Tax=Massilia sp. W12 TaxID=3126507 RepID=UPI0030D3B3FD
MTDKNLSLYSIATGSADPIYRQLMDQVRRLIASGQLPPGADMPSVRELAQFLAVNPMTVSKAWNLLEMEGLIVRRRGQGMSVAQHSHMQTPERGHLLRPTLQRAAQEVRQLELTDSEALTLFAQILKENP